MATATVSWLAQARAPCLLDSRANGFQRTFLVGCSSSHLLIRRSLNPSIVYRKTSAFPFCIRSDSNGGTDEEKTFGYTRKDVLLIGLGVTIVGVGLKYGLEFVGVDALKAGNAVQLVTILGLVGWTMSYVFRVSTKEMTYAKQLRDYERKVIEKRLEELPEAELESMLAQVEEEKQQLRARRDKTSTPE